MTGASKLAWPSHTRGGCARLGKFRRGLRFTVSLRTGGYFPRPCHAQFLVRGRAGRVKIRREAAAFFRDLSAAKNFPSMTRQQGVTSKQKRMCHVRAFKMGHD